MLKCRKLNNRKVRNFYLNKIIILVSRLDTEFKILNTLESGEFGVVYKCLSNIDDKIYAIKKAKKIVR